MSARGATCTVVGLGSMGFGMARSLLAGGRRVFGADLSAERVEALAALGGEAGAPGAAGPETDILVCVVLNAEQSRAVLFGPDGWAAHLRPGAVILGCATVPPDFAREMAAEAEARGLLYLDAPISGGAAKAAEGRLSIMAAGTAEAFAAARPALDAMAETVHDLGAAPGAGSAMKAVNQLLAGVHIAAMGEAMGFATALGLDLHKVLEVIGVSAGDSWMFSNRGPHVAEGDYAPRSAVTIWPKDLGIVAGIAAGAGLPVPMTETALARFRAAVEAGWGAEDDAAVAKLYAREAGLTLPGEE
ncbi:3-hydroxyisobutyrate dehydrogenase/2-hydroxy-3-oxopropionate reductase [Albimonas donghaensis]|uniref:L-threonate dehydrogenase n=1 Tax=Albimonas donghaensis TaxID=356660 RepID=A0A1H2TMH5_9RHOB|nr:L-threonate dehydrogenase [Albimonas donghaensis]SDW44905.1 3-hydroxyisobutyrate dehydrogenase/2-hydroxy-3-oxopropionate reductase [Albimonas donghaensis]